MEIRSSSGASTVGASQERPNPRRWKGPSLLCLVGTLASAVGMAVLHGQSRWPSEQKAALALRNGLATLLLQDVNRVRGAARFVFRHDPELIRKATSSYERRRRANSRKAREEEVAEEAEVEVAEEE